MKYEKKLELTKRKFSVQLGQFIGQIEIGVHQVRQAYGSNKVCTSGAEALDYMLANFSGTGRCLVLGKAWDESTKTWVDKKEEFRAVQEEVLAFWNSL